MKPRAKRKKSMKITENPARSATPSPRPVPQSHPASKSPSRPSTPPRLHAPDYTIRKHIAFWSLTFNGQEACFDHEQGAYYVAYLLLNPPDEPIHGMALEIKSLAYFGLFSKAACETEIINPSTGETMILAADAILQQRNFALDAASQARCCKSTNSRHPGKSRCFAGAVAKCAANCWSFMSGNRKVPLKPSTRPREPSKQFAWPCTGFTGAWRTLRTRAAIRTQSSAHCGLSEAIPHHSTARFCKPGSKPPVPGPPAASPMNRLRMCNGWHDRVGLPRSPGDASPGAETRPEEIIAASAFGRPIGGFQAVQHRLVDHTVRVRGMQLVVTEAARALTAADSDAPRAVTLAELAVSAGAVHVLHDLLQLTGAIGFTWEYGLHRYERRAHHDARLVGNPRRGAQPRGARRMDPMTDEHEAFRVRVRAFIAEHAPDIRHQEGVRAPRNADEERAIRGWLGALYDAGYLGAGWPGEWGGTADHLPIHDLILMEELFRARAYRPLDQVMFASHAILEFGTDAQRRELLPRIRRGEHIWCQLFSEPDAGSDLAALQTRAVADGESFVVTGQKVWSTDAQWADMGMLLARTDPTVDRHAGLTAFTVPMDLPGIDVRPIREMTGSAEFCEVFLDEVRLEAHHVLGAIGGGWKVITSGLASERAFVGANAVQLEMMFDDLVALASTAQFPDGTVAIEHEDVQLQLAHARYEVEAVTLIVRDAVEKILRAEDDPSDGPFIKLAYSELNVALCELALQLIASARDDAPSRAIVERWYENFLWSRALTISGGSSEILRGLVGRQLLGLPRT